MAMCDLVMQSCVARDDHSYLTLGALENKSTKDGNMKRLLLATVLVGVTSFTAFAQTKETMPMPDGMAKKEEPPMTGGAPAMGAMPMKDGMTKGGAMPMKDGAAATHAMPTKDDMPPADAMKK